MSMTELDRPADPAPAGSASATGRLPLGSARGPLESFLRHPILTILTILAITAAGVAVGLIRTPHYTATERLSVGRVDVPAYTLQGVIFGNQTLAGTYSRAISAQPVVAAAARSAGVSNSTALNGLDASQVPGSTLIQIEAVADSQQEAVKLANGASRGLITYVQQLNVEQAATSLLNRYRSAQAQTDRVRERYRAMLRTRPLPSLSSLESARLDVLTAQLRSQRLSSQIARDGGDPPSENLLQVLNPAVQATSDRATVTERLGLIGLGAGIIAGLGLAVLLANRELLRRRRTV